VRLIKGQILRLTVDGGGGGEDDLLTANSVHSLEELDCAKDILLLISERFLIRLSNSFKPCEVDHGLGAEICHDIFDGGAISNTHLMIIKHAIGEHGVGADIPCPSSDQDAHS